MLLGIKVLRMLDEIESYLRLSPFVFRMSILLFIIFYSVHITCCTFWLVKVSMCGGVWDTHFSSISHLLCMFIDKGLFLQLLDL
jgi:hypothetical protein